jgi:DNA-directed RNA polymerase III subunit RPC3
MVSQLRHKLIESVVALKFGEPSLRIWRLLWLKRHLEQKQISELALVPLKEARERLYTMFAHDFVHLQEIPRSANDYTPGKLIYLWSVRWEQVELLIRHEMYKTMHNLKLRLFHHLDEHRELLLKSDEEERLRQEGAQLSLLTPQEKQTLAQLRSIQDTLQHSLLKVDDSLMVLKDFPS